MIMRTIDYYLQTVKINLNYTFYNTITELFRIFASSIAESTVNGAGFAREAENPWAQGGGMIFVGKQ